MKIEALIVEECRLYVLKALEEKYTCNTFQFSKSNIASGSYQNFCAFSNARTHNKIAYNIKFNPESHCEIIFALINSNNSFSIKEMKQCLDQTSKLVELAEFIESKVDEFNTLHFGSTK